MGELFWNFGTTSTGTGFVELSAPQLNRFQVNPSALGLQPSVITITGRQDWVERLCEWTHSMPTSWQYHSNSCQIYFRLEAAVVLLLSLGHAKELLQLICLATVVHVIVSAAMAYPSALRHTDSNICVTAALQKLDHLIYVLRLMMHLAHGLQNVFEGIQVKTYMSQVLDDGQPTRQIAPARDAGPLSEGCGKLYVIYRQLEMFEV
ncbi:hypothetical protein DAEQUDRAFT_760468 [Daedalea quercina L-15889]|uniref:Uncharacterized protein n=1 Tax=Daedalea quercina L-15889 TaxID=1314783 RepID=A0A165KQM3_9APHY|nr:hypothetical protein DAEQUDRAFT_760468 [Daedalea quercina L-15889]